MSTPMPAAERFRLLNALGLLAVGAVLVAAFVDQIAFNDLPCPLCILQRAGFLGVAAGLALNVKFGPRPSHYGVMLLSALAGGAVSMRQTLLHIIPGEGAYGDAFFGLHFYAWALILFIVCIAGTAVLLLFDRQFEPPGTAPVRRRGLLPFGAVTIVLALLLALANGGSTVIECGGGLCPDNPTSYRLIDDGTIDALFGPVLGPLRDLVGR
ncbi:disulfide bond formation protein B [Xanthobacter sp. AM11]|uniref:disulfide bond formation protein B n=1 Tax=Xanthobacter sp. AM11 TaxID=3380643 RepID=UPI0039BF8663